MRSNRLEASEPAGPAGPRSAVCSMLRRAEGIVARFARLIDVVVERQDHVDVAGSGGGIDRLGRCCIVLGFAGEYFWLLPDLGPRSRLAHIRACSDREPTRDFRSCRGHGLSLGA